MHEGDFRATIRARAAALGRRIAFPESSDARTLEAVAQLHREKLCVPVLIGDPGSITTALRGYTDEAESIEMFDPREARRDALAQQLADRRKHRGWTAADAQARLDDPILLTAMLVHAGIVDGFVAGAVSTTADVIRAAIWAIGTAEGVSNVSSSFYMAVNPFRGSEADEVLTFTDAAVIADPTSRQLVDIAAAASAARTKIVGDEPVVAFLSFSTKGSAQGPSITKVREAAAMFAEAHPDIRADGELQADAALIDAIARRKAPGSQVAGGANILVFPNLDAGNIAYKLVQRLAGADAVGPILQGLEKPCSDLSRGAVPSDIVDAACITAVQV